jgi:hypothetical protein
MRYTTRSIQRMALAAMAVLATAVAAEARPDTRAMTCGQTQNLIRQSGAIVLTTGQHTYDRYVSSGAYCAREEDPHSAYVKTKDASQCRVLRCEPADDLFDRD